MRLPPPLVLSHRCLRSDCVVCWRGSRWRRLPLSARGTDGAAGDGRDDGDVRRVLPDRVWTCLTTRRRVT